MPEAQSDSAVAGPCDFDLYRSDREVYRRRESFVDNRRCHNESSVLFVEWWCRLELLSQAAFAVDLAV